MSDVQQVRKTIVRDGNTVETVQEVRNPGHENEHQQNIIARVIWYIADVLLVLLAFRFVLALLGANPGNSFSHFIYSTSYPFVKPFFGIFGYNLQYGVSRVESYTLVAMAVYALVTFGIVKLITINREPAAQ